MYLCQYKLFYNQNKCMHAQSLQLCPTFWDSMDCNPPGSSLHGILQKRILERVAMTFSRGSSRPRDQTSDSCTSRRVLYTSTTWETPEYNYFPGGSDGKVSAYNAGDLGSIPGSGRSPGEGNGHPLQYSWLENPMDRGAWRTTIHGVTKSQTGLSTYTPKRHQVLSFSEKRS